EGIRHLLRISAKFPEIVGGLAGGDTSYSMKMNLGAALPDLFSDPSAAPELEIPQDEGVCSADPATYCRMKDPTNPLLGAQCPRKELDDRTCIALGTEDKVMATKSIRTAVEMVDQFFGIKSGLGSVQAEFIAALADAQTALKLYFATGAFFVIDKFVLTSEGIVEKVEPIAEGQASFIPSPWGGDGCTDADLTDSEQIVKMAEFSKVVMNELKPLFGLEADQINAFLGEGGMWEPVVGLP
ncbi:uncharacterized protein METZ01_LOCUS485806, partial [marine metagenome]